MRRFVTAWVVLAGVLGLGISPGWNRIASADEGCGGAGMMGQRRPPEMMQGMRAPGPWFYGRGGHEGPLVSLMLERKDQLGLTADQEKSLRELRANFEKEVITRTADIDVARLELKGLLEQEKVDLTKVEAQAKKIGLLRAELRFARIKTIEAGKAVLTADQVEKFKRLSHEPSMGGMGMMEPPMRGPWMRQSPPARY